MDATITLSDRSNARRAARRMLEKGDAPATEFEIEPGTDGRFVIVWRTDQTPNPSPNTELTENEIAGTTAEADPPTASTERVGEPSEDPELAAFETQRLVAELARRGYRSTQLRQRRSAERPAKECRRSRRANSIRPRLAASCRKSRSSPRRPTSITRSGSTGWPNSPPSATGPRSPPKRSRAIIPTRRRSRVTAIGCSPLTPRRRPPHSYAACFRTSLDRLLLDFPPDTAWASGASDQRIFILRRHRLTLRAATRRTIRWICPR